MQQPDLNLPIEYLKGVGPNRADIIKKELQIFTVNELLHFFPYKYSDRTKYYKINELTKNNKSEVQIIGKIIHLKTVEQKRGKRLVATFTDGVSKMELVWFRGHKWINDNLKINVPYVIFGKTNWYGQTLSMPHPEMELYEEHQNKIQSGLQAVYPSTETLGKRNISNKVIQRIIAEAVNYALPALEEILPIDLRKKLHLVSKQEAIFHVHFPETGEKLNLAQYRIKFEELFLIQMQLINQNIFRKQKIQGYPFEIVGEKFHDFYNNHLPFPLTNAQKKVIKEIRSDMAKPVQMNRLLQGDVGSGKTVVAFLSALIAIDNDFQACIMAPTEILANQHFNGLQEWAGQIGVNIGLLTGSTKTAQRRQILEDLINGNLTILIGTHAILEDPVKFNNLGLAIIDEQHRFGVDQRAKLWKKNHLPPHVLVMTATPIPRTLAMSLYGDLDVSVIDELPPGRKPVQTIHYYEGKRLRVWKFVKDEIAKGRQVYMVYPLIQESEKLDYKNLMDGYEGISRDFPLPDYAISIVHGQMTATEKDREMARFVKGETQIMIATTVIEVGVNVPNATVMVIESAERFGLSQLHQLRGRVGRGGDQSYCILMTGNKLSNDSQVRMDTMCRTNDGFEIAEVDLKLRGPGDLMGTQQSGVLNLRMADLVKDQQILSLARQQAVLLLQNDIKLENPEHQKLKLVLTQIMKKSGLYSFIS